MRWNDYSVVFEDVSLAERAADEGLFETGRFERYIRACSERDARYRVVRKFILPIDAEIVSVVMV